MIIFPDKSRACNNPKPTLVITQGWGTMDKWTIDLSASFIPFSVQKQGNFCHYRQEKDNKVGLERCSQTTIFFLFLGDNDVFPLLFLQKQRLFLVFFEKSLQLSHDLGQAPPKFASEIINQFINQLKK